MILTLEQIQQAISGNANHVGLLTGHTEICPMPNTTGSVHNIEDLKMIVQLQVERDALVAQVEHLCYQITNIALCYDNNTGYEPSLSVFHRALDEAQEFIEKTPAQCLAEIKAQVVEVEANYIMTAHRDSDKDWHFERVNAFAFIGKKMLERAEDIRKGGAKC